MGIVNAKRETSIIDSTNIIISMIVEYLQNLNNQELIALNHNMKSNGLEFGTDKTGAGGLGSCHIKISNSSKEVKIDINRVPSIGKNEYRLSIDVAGKKHLDFYKSTNLKEKSHNFMNEILNKITAYKNSVSSQLNNDEIEINNALDIFKR